MPKEKHFLRKDFVSSIFSRPGKKNLSSIFAPTRKKRLSGVKALKSDRDKYPIKKKIPLGIDMGTGYIKILQLGLDYQGNIRVLSKICKKLPLGAQFNPGERETIISQILKEVVEEKGLKGGCFVTLPWDSAKVDLIKLPQMPENEIEKALRWEIKQAKYPDLDEMCLDYIVLESKEMGFLENQIGILAVSAYKKDVLKHLSLLKSIGLNVLAIDIEQLANLAVLNYKKGKSNEVVLLLDFGAGKTSLNIIYRGNLIFTRTLNISGNSLTRAISEYCRISWDEAEEVKKGVQILGPLKDSDTQRAGQVIRAKNAILLLLDDMVQTIEHTFKYFSYQIALSRIIKFDRVILTGGSSSLPGFDIFLKGRLGVEVEILDTLAGLDIGEEPLSKTLGLPLSVSLGLALRGIGE